MSKRRRIPKVPYGWNVFVGIRADGQHSMSMDSPRSSSTDLCASTHNLKEAREVIDELDYICRFLEGKL